jgi:hypothetical protein
MPVRGARVRRSKWFYEITQTLADHGFRRGAPGHFACPGFYFFNRDGYIVQILPKNAIRITRPNGTVETESVSRMSKANFILSAIARYIDDQRESAGELS